MNTRERLYEQNATGEIIIIACNFNHVITRAASNINFQYAQ